MAYGVPGERKHPRVLEAADKILRACRTHDTIAAFPVGDAEEARWAQAQGYRLIGFGGAESYVMQTSRAFLEAAGR